MYDSGPQWSFESRIDPSELQIGHYVTRLDIPWSQTRFPFEGVLIDSPEKKAWMIKHCAWVVICHVRSPNPVRPRPLSTSAAVQAPPARSQHLNLDFLALGVTRETVEEAFKVYDSLDEQANYLIDQFRERNRLDVSSARDVVRELAGALEQNMSALIWLTRIKQKDQYTAQHCINVSILAIGLAHAMNWNRKRVEHAGLAGLLHDLGKMLVDQEVLNKPGRLNQAEYEEIKRHTSLGFEMLRKDGKLPELVLEGVLSHHERPDGSGYPRGLKGTDIPPLARLVSIVDAYDAITSHRVYDPARSHHDALGILWKQRNRQFDAQMTGAFTQYLGWVTPGTLVRLTDDRLAVVLQAQGGRGLLPLVQIVEEVGGEYRLTEEVDLSRLRPEHGDAPLRVAEVLPDGSLGVDIRALSKML